MNGIRYFGATDMGRVRTNNEDSFVAQSVWNEHYALCVAIDGVGGYEGGEVAAEIARKTLIDYVTKHEGENGLEVLKQAVVEANNAIVSEKERTGQYSYMACVLTAGLFDLQHHQLNVVHVGDSRLYQYAAGELRKLTHDHSLVGFREEMGELTEEEAMHHPQRNLIERMVGDVRHELDDANFLDAGIFPLVTDAQFVFCSDGLTDMVTSATIRRVLDQDATVEEKAARLIAAANDAGGKDNVTVVVASVKVDEAEQTTNEAEITKINRTTETKRVSGTNRSVESTGTTHATEHIVTDDVRPAQSFQPLEQPRKRKKSGYVLLWLLGLVMGGGIATFYWMDELDKEQMLRERTVVELNEKMSWQDTHIAELEQEVQVLTDSLEQQQ